ncbi:hypothetical protein SAMN05216203_0348 [Marinobacter daqiaonensis]|uniref:J domain-containing protein n=1 Tax=Marinobacter daqiaonensis TaxID=650891 RepID=A0A1I6GPP9_9GAMM|nr:hypothetical protein [Marinobacter daqiaonensis]SFR44138.1 hypothetical protein SAMN05216203_0348 [Marinobacter daqiaonensis]
MNCWEVLGIEPTGDSRAIREAYERQSKFAEGEDAEQLESAYQKAMEEAGHSSDRQTGGADTSVSPRAPAGAGPSDWQSEANSRPLSAEEEQVVREVVIQIKALLNDSARASDVAIWRAILTEPPADEDAIRAAIGRELEPELRPLADDAWFAPPVARFLGDWFGWYGMTDAVEQHQNSDATIDDAGRYQGISRFPDTDAEDQQSDPDRPKMANFWPAVIGWIVGIIILTSLFGGLVGGG